MLTSLPESVKQPQRRAPGQNGAWSRMTSEHEQAGLARDLVEDLRWRENVQSAAREWGVDVDQIKPCVARIREVANGERNLSAYILATELRRMGVSPQRADRVMTRWNSDNRPALSVAELAGIIKSAYGGEKTYWCSGPLSEWCIGKHNCPWYARYVCGPGEVRGRTSMIDFERLGWHSPHVTLAERATYGGIIRLEAIRDCGPGGCVITSLRQLARLIGISPSGVRVALLVLDALGLIDYRPGTPRATGRPVKGCLIRRVIPIPDPRVDSARATRRRGRGTTSADLSNSSRKRPSPAPAPSPAPQDPLLNTSSTCTESAPIVRSVHVSGGPGCPSGRA